MPDFNTQSIAIDGMHCDACVRRVTAALAQLPGVRVQHVEIGRAEFLGEPATYAPVRSAIEEAGYSLQEPNAAG